MAIRLCRTSRVALKSLIILLCGCQMIRPPPFCTNFDQK
ncbi:hypothetical protein Vi05172_g11142 [Venturia inaequalis]|nr:hypothetical protein Vi05172_g11142 [Venturia inaequalis]